MKRPTNSKRHLPGEVAAKLRQADDALAKGVAIAEVEAEISAYDATPAG